MSARRSPDEITRALARLNTEELIRLADLASLPLTIGGVVVRPSYLTLKRWGTEGKGGVYLDVLVMRRTGELVTSRPALERFARELATAPTASG